MAAPLALGVFNINMHVCSEPEAIARVARAAEDAGFESLWTGEHVVLPDPQVPPSPLPPQSRLLDPAVALTWAAAHTSRVKLGTGIVILPQRNPLVLAKELASVDVLSGGRLLFGVGVGYLEPEFAALGVPFDDRDGRTLDALAAMRAVWSSDTPSHDGPYWRFSGVQAQPRPVQQPGPPVVMGGHSAAAHRRAVTTCEGWYGFALDVDGTAEQIAGLRRAAERYERPAELGRLEITVTPRGRVDAAMVERFAELGVDRLVLTPRGDDVEGWLATIEGWASTLL
ncbi:MAG: LLM class F420-dependent oxidoreductase [Actinobacteria bacterium]|nr:LLM class F420-dependent oxidoreductase [Actinomycetota bacterium]